jgi:hypothetical protein
VKALASKCLPTPNSRLGITCYCPDLAGKTGALRFGIIRTREDQFERLEKQLQRELTPSERKWLKLTDELLTRAERLDLLRLQKETTRALSEP